MGSIGETSRRFRDTRTVEAFGYVVIAVLALSVIAALVIARKPPAWDELGGESPVPQFDAEESAALPLDDESSLRALVAEKRARRLAAGGRAVASDARPAVPRAPWSHLDAEVVEEARGLVARRRARLERQGKPAPDEQGELERLLGPPHG